MNEQGSRDSLTETSRDSEFNLSAIPINKIFTLIFIHDKDKDQVQEQQRYAFGSIINRGLVVILMLNSSF